MVEKVRLVLLPGLLCDTELWRDQIAGLRDIADCTVADMSRDDSIAGTAARMLEKAPAKFAVPGTPTIVPRPTATLDCHATVAASWRWVAIARWR